MLLFDYSFISFHVSSQLYFSNIFFSRDEMELARLLVKILILILERINCFKGPTLVTIILPTGKTDTFELKIADSFVTFLSLL